jgi:predicted acetyltransferase
MPQTIRVIEPDELPAWFQAFATAFYIWANDPHALAAARRDTIELDRVVGAFEDGQIVGTFRTFPTRLTLPGGAQVPVNAVSGVSVRPTHTRRGTLSRMIAFDIERAAARGDVACVLIASEWPIYGRFGYGPATWHARWTIRTRAARIAGEPVGTIEMVDALAGRKLIPEIYAAYAAAQPGEIEREEHRWDATLGIVELPGRPRWQGSIAIHRDAAGKPDGYARYHGEEVWDDGIPDNVLILDELHGMTPEAELDLWRFLVAMDLTATIRADTRREREPLQWHLSDGRAARVTGLSDFLWVRILDVERALGERRYDRDGSIVLEVRDELNGSPGPAAGTYTLGVRDGAGTCRRTDAKPDLTIDVRALGAALLGGTNLRDVTRAEGASEHRPGALTEADALLRTADAPWCSSWF